MRHEAIEQVRFGLLDLHRTLLDVVRAEYERDRGPIAGANQLLQLVTTDELFAWLHPLSELVVAIDDLLESSESIGPDDAAAVRAEAEEILERRGGPFRERYIAALQVEPSAVLDHAKLKKAVAALPQPAPENIAELLHARHRWAEARSHRYRRKP